MQDCTDCIYFEHGVPSKECYDCPVFKEILEKFHQIRKENKDK